jgi:hypothetical protein
MGGAVPLTCEETTYPGSLLFNPHAREYLAMWSYYEHSIEEKDIFGQRVRTVPP